jgi:hypothetical protein
MSLVALQTGHMEFSLEAAGRCRFVILAFSRCRMGAKKHGETAGDHDWGQRRFNVGTGATIS